MQPDGPDDQLQAGQLELPGVPPRLLEALSHSACGARLALVGGAVRDLLLHRVHNDPWRGLPDLDLVVEGDGQRAEAPRLAERLAGSGRVAVRAWREHGAYGTVEIEVLLPARATAAGSTAGATGAAAAACPCENAEGGASRGTASQAESSPAEPLLPAGPPAQTVLLDVATARSERYPVAAANPVVRFGSLEDDLERRDFTINAIALLLTQPPRLLDPHGGQRDLQRRRLRFLQASSLRDDPTRLLRAARYRARLGFPLAAESEAQARASLAAWPWPWRHGDPPEQAPAALGTRLRMELELLLERERWPVALEALQGWGGLILLDAALQTDRCWRRRLRWAGRLGLPRIVALLVAADDPLALAARLQLPHRQQRLLEALAGLRARLAPLDRATPRSPADWAALLEAHGTPPEAVALALAAAIGPRRPLLRWWFRWRHVRPALRARDLIAGGLRPGPELGERLRALRAEALAGERP